MAELLEACSGTALAGLTGKHKHSMFPSLWQSLLAATFSDILGRALETHKDRKMYLLQAVCPF